jgi:hypothetical protein
VTIAFGLEWIAEGVFLMFVGVLVAVVTAVDSSAACLVPCTSCRPAGSSPSRSCLR